MSSQTLLRLHSERGFTLIELLACITCIGILSAVAMTEIAQYRVKVYDRIAFNEVRSLMLANEAIYAGTQAYNTVTCGGAECETTLSGYKKTKSLAIGSGGTDTAPTTYAGKGYVSYACHPKGKKVYIFVTLDSPPGLAPIVCAGLPNNKITAKTATAVGGCPSVASDDAQALFIKAYFNAACFGLAL
ncbi:type II secretion system protein [bacterium]|nr:type II secretion system protein [bacterium]